jgi:hypothetical protein
VNLVNIEVSSGHANVLAGSVEGWQGKAAKLRIRDPQQRFMTTGRAPVATAVS